MSAASIIEVEQTGKVFDAAGNTVEALRGIDLAIREGEFVSLLGPSGCGKSTLLRLMADLSSPTSGTVRVNGKTARQARLDRDYGMVFQRPGLMDWRTVRRNVELPMKVAGAPAQERRERADAMLDLVRLSDFAGHYPWQLSGGMQQRVAIARALTSRPSLLFMDEPLGALDEMNREHLQDELLRIWDGSKTSVVFVTHSVTEAVFLSTRVVIMSPRPGRIVDSIDIDLPTPRTYETRSTPEFFAKVAQVRASLHSVLDGAAA